jgi:hypothetical protein
LLNTGPALYALNLKSYVSEHVAYYFYMLCQTYPLTIKGLVTSLPESVRCANRIVQGAGNGNNSIAESNQSKKRKSMAEHAVESVQKEIQRRIIVLEALESTTTPVAIQAETLNPVAIQAVTLNPNNETMAAVLPGFLAPVTALQADTPVHNGAIITTALPVTGHNIPPGFLAPFATLPADAVPTQDDDLTYTNSECAVVLQSRHIFPAGFLTPAHNVLASSVTAVTNSNDGGTLNIGLTGMQANRTTFTSSVCNDFLHACHSFAGNPVGGLVDQGVAIRQVPAGFLTPAHTLPTDSVSLFTNSNVGAVIEKVTVDTLYDDDDDDDPILQYRHTFAETPVGFREPNDSNYAEL